MKYCIQFCVDSYKHILLLVMVLVNHLLKVSGNSSTRLICVRKELSIHLLKINH